MTDALRPHRHRCPARYDAMAASRYQLGELHGDERTAYERHLPDCRTCRTALDGQRALDALAARLPTYRAPVAAPRGERTGRGTGRRLRTVAGIAFAAAAAAVLLVARIGDEPNRTGGGDTDPGADLVALVRAAHAADVPPLALGTDSAGPADERSTASGHPDSAWAQVPWLGFVSCDGAIEPEVDGVFLCALDAAGPLGQAGARAGDVLLRVGGERIAGQEAMVRVLARHAVGDEIPVAFRTGDTVRTARVRLVRRTRSPRFPFDLEWSPALIEHANTSRPGEIDPFDVFRAVRSPRGSDALAGVVVARALTREEWSSTRLLRRFPYPFAPGGLAAGDTVIAVDGQPVMRWSDFFEAYGARRTRPIVLEVRRGERARIEVPLRQSR